MKQWMYRFLFKNETPSQIVAKNTLWLFSGEIASRFLRFLLIIFAARMLGAAGLGLFSYAMALGGMFMFFEDAGIGMYVTRTLIQDPEKRDRLIATASILKLALLALAIILFIVIGPVITSLPGAEMLIPAMALVLVFDSLREFTFTISRAQQRMQVESIIKLLTGFFMLLFGLVLLFLHPTALMLTWGYAIGGGLGFCIAFWYTKNYFKNPFSFFSKDLIIVIFKAAWPFTILAIFNIVIFSIDTFFLGRFAGAAEVGSYAAAQRLAQLTYVLPSLFISTTFPMFTKKIAEEHGYRYALEKLSGLLIVLAVPLIVGICLWSNELLGLVFGQAFTNAAPVLNIMSFGLLPLFIMSAYSAVIFAENKQRKFVMVNIAVIIANIIFDLLLIPTLHAPGAALAGTLSIYVLTIFTALRFTSITRFNILAYIRPLYIVIAALLMGALSVALVKLQFPVLIGLPIATLLYVAIVFYTHKRQIHDTGITALLVGGKYRMK